MSESQQAQNYGYLYLFEGDTVRKTLFYDALNTLSESDDSVNTFLENWEKSVDYQLEILKEEDLAAGPIWTLLYQSWELEQKLKAKAMDKIISVKIVDGVSEAIDHINNYSSGHTESIITENSKTFETFYKNINSAIILQNASTQFADGGEFGFGAEIGISTDKLHVRGPVGSEHLTSFKYVVHGNGQVRP